jgi:hypothetical protein
MAPAPAPPVIEEDDDPSMPVKAGTTCRRKGCDVVYESDEVNRIGDGAGTVCTYHSAPVSPTSNNLIYRFSNGLSQYSGKEARCVEGVSK